jgi:DNA-binding NarL/FixJ family response regulator
VNEPSSKEQPDRDGAGETMTIRVAIVDDQALMRDGFTMILDAQPDIEVVGDAENGRVGLELCRRTRPDVVLMDIRMPVLDGIEATRLIVSDDDHETKVLVLTTFDLDEYVYAALRAGASGYLLKDTPAKELVAAVRVIAQGDSLLSPSVTSAPRRPDRPRAGGARVAGPRSQQPRDRRHDVHRRGHGQDPRQPAADQARGSRSGPGGRAGVRDRSRPAGRLSASPPFDGRGVRRRAVAT